MVKNNVMLRPHSNYRIGGPAAYFCEPKSREELGEELKRWRDQSRSIKDFLGSVFILGGGTNLLIADEGYKGLVVKPNIASLKVDGAIVSVGAGLPVAKLLEFTVAKGLSGLEWAGGLPGTVGGAIRGNAGAFGGEIKDTVVSVTSMDLGSARQGIRRRSRSECCFGYRTSVFRELDESGKGKEIVLSAVMKLAKGNRKRIREDIEAKIRYREERHPINYPNIGSIFRNIDVKNVPRARLAQFKGKIKSDPFPVLPTAVVIAEAGLKGVSFGGAMISPKHPNFIVNVLDAKASEVKTLIKLVKYTVRGKFGIVLEEEVVYV